MSRKIVLFIFLILTSCSSSRIQNLIIEADRFQRAGQYDKALRKFNEAVNLDPKNITALSGKTASLVSLGHLTQAKQTAKLALELEPNSAYTNYNLGLIEMQLGKFKSAIKLFNRAIETDPKWADPIWNRGTAYDELAEWDKAIADYDKALLIEPRNADIYSNRGYTKYKLQDFKGSLNDFNKALEINPEHQKAKSNLELLKNK